MIIECFSSCRLALHQEKTKIVFLQERYRKPGDGGAGTKFYFLCFLASDHLFGGYACVCGFGGGYLEYESCVIGKAIKDRTEKTGKTPKAIVPVALYGMPYKVDEIMAVADRV